MERTAWTSIIALSHDSPAPIYDRQERQVCMMDALPIHTNSMHVVLKEIARVFDGDIHEGDVIVCNDPYSGNTHVGDFVTACPVFYKGEHLFWSVTKGHQLDCGAFIPTSVPATAKDVWQEGLQLPPIKFYRKGKPCEDIIRMYLANVRWQGWLYGDLMAQLGSIWTGRRRILEMLERYGKDELERYIDAIFDYSDERMAAGNSRHARRRVSRRCLAGHRWPGRHQHPDPRQGDDPGRHGACGLRRLRATDAAFQQQHPGRDAGGGRHPDHVHDRPHHSAQRRLPAAHHGGGAGGLGLQRQPPGLHRARDDLPRRHHANRSVEGARPGHARARERRYARHPLRSHVLRHGSAFR